MVAVAAVRLADTGLPSAALSGCWRISIKAQYLAASKGSDVTAATQDLLLHLHQHAASRHICERRGKIAVEADKRRRFSRTPAPLELQAGPVEPKGLHHPACLCRGTFLSSLLKAFMLHGHRQNLPGTLQFQRFQTPPKIWLFGRSVSSDGSRSCPLPQMNHFKIKWITTAYLFSTQLQKKKKMIKKTKTKIGSFGNVIAWFRSFLLITVAQIGTDGLSIEL